MGGLGAILGHFGVHFGAQNGAKTSQKCSPNSERGFEGFLSPFWSKFASLFVTFSTISAIKRENSERVNFNNTPHEKLFSAVSTVPFLLKSPIISGSDGRACF